LCLAWLVAACASDQPQGASDRTKQAPPRQDPPAHSAMDRERRAPAAGGLLHVPRRPLHGAGDGSRRRAIAKFPGPPYPYGEEYWSPDGAQLLIRTEVDTGSTVAGYIFRIDADGSNVTNLSKRSGSRYDATPAWSPDGTEVVYSATKPGDTVASLYIMNSEGSDPRKLAELGFEAQYPSWSVDGRIAFAGVNTGEFDLYAIGPDGSGLTRLTDDPADDNWPSYSPDGSQIAFFSNRDGTEGIWVMEADARKIAEGGEPSWSLHGDWIVLDCGNEERPLICAARPDGSLVVELFGRASFPAIRP
jgi:WD40-like Beta Propeller Repeat